MKAPSAQLSKCSVGLSSSPRFEVSSFRQELNPLVEVADQLCNAVENFQGSEAALLREMIEAALTVSRGKIAGPAGAAAKLGIPRQTLDSKIVNLGIDKRRFKVQSPAN